MNRRDHGTAPRPLSRDEAASIPEKDCLPDEAPLDCPPHLLRKTFARRFRWAAEKFRNPDGGPFALLHLGNGRHAKLPQGLDDKCGQWLISARNRGLIPMEFHELHDAIALHTSPTPDLEDRQAVRVHCPSNLFQDVVGGGVITGILKGEDERGRIILENQRETGGLLPRYAPGHLELPHDERYAATCEFLADLIEHHADSQSRPISHAGAAGTDVPKEVTPNGTRLIAGPKGDTHLSDAAFIDLVKNRIDALYLSYCDLDESDDASPRDVEEVRNKRSVVEERKKELLDAISDRLDSLIAKHLPTQPGDWGIKFIEELLGLRDSRPSLALGIVQRRYNQILPLARLLRNSEREKYSEGAGMITSLSQMSHDNFHLELPETGNGMKLARLLKLMHCLLDRGIASPNEALLFAEMPHEQLVRTFTAYLNQHRHYLGYCHIEQSHALNDRGVDIILQTENGKVGFQIKSHFDVTEANFAANVKRQLTESLAHGLDHYIILICCPLRKEGKVDLEQKISHLLNELSSLKSDYHSVYGPTNTVQYFLGMAPLTREELLLRRAIDNDALHEHEKGFEHLPEVDDDEDVRGARAKLESFDEDWWDEPGGQEAFDKWSRVRRRKVAEQFTSRFLPTLPVEVQRRRSELTSTVQALLASCRKCRSWSDRSEFKLSQWLDNVDEELIPYTSLPNLLNIVESLKRYLDVHMRLDAETEQTDAGSLLDQQPSDVSFIDSEISGGKGEVGPGGDVKIKGAVGGGSIRFIGGRIKGGDGGTATGKGGNVTIEGGPG